MNKELTTAQTNVASQQLIVQFPKIERLPVDPPIAGQNYGLFSFKFLPKPLNGVYGFLKFRGAFATEQEWEAHAKNIIRTVDSKHHIWPYQQGRWMPITTNEEFAQETLEVSQHEELRNLYHGRETAEQRQEANRVREIKSRERKLMEETSTKETNKETIDYYAQQVMKVQQLTGWLEDMRKRKRDMLKALKSGKKEIKALDEIHPEFKYQVQAKINEIRAEIGLEPEDSLHRPSLKLA